jgi:hypothetical protein
MMPANLGPYRYNNRSPISFCTPTTQQAPECTEIFNDTKPAETTMLSAQPSAIRTIWPCFVSCLRRVGVVCLVIVVVSPTRVVVTTPPGVVPTPGPVVVATSNGVVVFTATVVPSRSIHQSSIAVVQQKLHGFITKTVVMRIFYR